jgi:LCP family protein required for cell wall assembly
MILTTFMPQTPYVGMLSIPRDLWVNIPNFGDDRINTAHFYAEASQPGTGPAAAKETVRQNFGVNVDYYMRVRFDGIRNIVDAMGGLDVELPRDMSGYTAGTHHLDGQQALVLVRDRAGSDDLYRTERAQIFIKSMFNQLLRPTIWPRLPAVLFAITQSVDTDVPSWQWPRLLIAVLRVGVNSIDGRTITHEMVTPFVTSGGAQVLLPNWELINPVLMDVFGQ